MKKTLQQMADEVYECNLANGWYKSERSFDDDIALLHTEISEAFEAYRDHGFDDAGRLKVPHDPEAVPVAVRPLVERYLAHSHRVALEDGRDPGADFTLTAEEKHALAAAGLMKPEGVGSELADVLVRLLDSAHRRGWDLAQIEAHAGIPAHPATFSRGVVWMHRTVGLLGASGPVVHHQLATCLYTELLGTARLAGVDLDYEYERKMAYNRTRGHRHGGKRV